MTGSRRAARAAAENKRRSSSAKGVIKQLLGVGAMAGAMALLISTSLPALAVNPGDSIAASVSAGVLADSAPSSEEETQSVLVNAAAAEAAADATPVERDKFQALTQQQAIVTSRVTPNWSYTNNPYGTIQWPFPYTVPISQGFGTQHTCSYCSAFHAGVDFVPGAGTPIQAITAGTVSQVVVGDGSYGNYVVIDHVIDGQKVQSMYAHMAWGSIQVAVGQVVEVGTTVGQVGSSGVATGPHLHLEIHVNGSPVNPFTWLKANAN